MNIMGIKTKDAQSILREKIIHAKTTHNEIAK